jgi:hypothetical protein
VNKLVISLFVIMTACLPMALADAPRYDTSWQWNDNVKIEFIYTYWEGGSMQVRLNNGEFCYIKDTEDALKASVLTAKAQNASVWVVCRAEADSTVDGKDSRHMHRFRF